MKKFVPAILISVFALLIVTGIFMMSLGAPNVKQIKNISITKTKPGMLSMSSELTLESDNWFSINAYDLAISIRYDSHLIGKSNSIEKYRISSGETSVPITIDYFLDSIDQYIPQSDANDSIQAQVEISGGFTFMGLKSSHSFNIWLPIQPMKSAIFSNLASKNKFVLEKIEVAESDIMKTKLTADFKLSNDSKIDFNVESVSCDIYLDSSQKTSIANWSNSDKQVIKAGASQTLNGIFEVDHFGGIFQGVSKVLNGNLDLLLIGKVKLNRNGERFEIPLKQKVPYHLVFSQISNVIPW